MSRARIAAFVLLAATASGQPVTVAAPPDPAVEPSAPLAGAAITPSATAPRAPTIEQDGQTFQLANSTSAKNVETDEYVVAGEKIGDWTQLLTVQRLALAKSAGADEFLAYFQKRVAGDGASFEVVKQSPAATVFAVRFPRSERNDEQVMICLAFVAPDQPERLNVVQYAIKPLRAPVAVVAMRLRSWKDRFVRQAGASTAAAAQ